MREQKKQRGIKTMREGGGRETEVQRKEIVGIGESNGPRNVKHPKNEGNPKVKEKRAKAHEELAPRGEPTSSNVADVGGNHKGHIAASVRQNEVDKNWRLAPLNRKRTTISPKEREHNGVNGQPQTRIR